MDLENFHLEKGGGLQSPTPLPQSSGTQAEGTPRRACLVFWGLGAGHSRF